MMHESNLSGNRNSACCFLSRWITQPTLKGQLYGLLRWRQQEGGAGTLVLAAAVANIYSWYQENCDAGNKETMIRVPMDNGCKVTQLYV